MTEQVIDTFENPFLGLEGKIMRELQEENKESDPVQVNANDRDFEQQIFESFVKEKATLLSYVTDLLQFAAKSQSIDLVQAKVLEGYNTAEAAEESKTEPELRIKNNQECGILAARINAVVSIIKQTNHPGAQLNC